MTLTDFLAKHQFRSYSSPINSWDSFRADGTTLMQLWDEDRTMVRDLSKPDHYMRVRCWNSQHFAEDGKRVATGYNGRRKAVESFRSGSKAYVIISVPPSAEKPGPGTWARYANLERAYPVLALEEPPNGDIFVVVGRPIDVANL